VADLGALAPGESTGFECSMEDVDAAIDNIAVAAGSPPNGGDDVGDSDPSSVLVIAPSALVGDLVWNDQNENGVQDAGEEGIPSAEVKLTNLDTDEVTFQTTNSDGKYLFAALAQAEYKAELVMSSVDGDLTTPGSFTFFLPDGGSYLDADFGVVQTLPVTGVDADRMAGLGLALLALGILMVMLARHRRREEL
jgi:hypothetical protein